MERRPIREALACALLLGACASIYAKPAVYEGELTACNQTAKTCEESIRCENEVRAKQKPPRPRRPFDGCGRRDAGAD